MHFGGVATAGVPICVMPCSSVPEKSHAKSQLFVPIDIVRDSQYVLMMASMSSDSCYRQRLPLATDVE